MQVTKEDLVHYGKCGTCDDIIWLHRDGKHSIMCVAGHCVIRRGVGPEPSDHWVDVSDEELESALAIAYANVDHA